jgi:hypothetical protein
MHVVRLRNHVDSSAAKVKRGWHDQETTWCYLQYNQKKGAYVHGAGVG